MAGLVVWVDLDFVPSFFDHGDGDQVDQVDQGAESYTTPDPFQKIGSV
jgi:hypothetical protein